MRIVIVGGPLSGKSTLAQKLPLKHYCTDSKSNTREITEGTEYLPDGLEWGEDSEYVLTWFEKEGVIEGVATARALRKWKERKEGKPCDLIIVLTEAKANLTEGQRDMTKGVFTVWNEIAEHYKDITLYGR